MKKLSLSKILVFIAPYIAYALVIAIPYSGVVHYMYSSIIPERTNSQMYYYLLGLSIFIPMLILNIVNKRLKHFWQYFLFSVVLVGLSIVLSSCYIYPIFVAFLFFIRLVARVREEESFMDVFHWAMLLLPVLYFIVTGFYDMEFFQFLSVISFIIMAVLYFAYEGLTRVDEYLSINKKMANFPYKRIEKVGNSLFLGLAFILLVTIVPLTFKSYEFVHLEITIEESDYVYEEEIVEEEEVTEQEGEGMSMSEMFGDGGEPWIGWDILTYILLAAIIYYGGKAIYKFIREFLRDFTRTAAVVEKDDVIESTVDLMDKYEKFKKDKIDKIKFFDFSPNAVVRKKYKKAVKSKKKPDIEKWQSPSEIETMVKLENQELHRLYEKARYSKTGVTKEEI